MALLKDDPSYRSFFFLKMTNFLHFYSDLMLPMSFVCEMDAVPYDDRELYYAIQKSQESNSVLPVIKVELKRKIQFRRFSNGEEKIKPRWNKQEIRTVCILRVFVRQSKFLQYFKSIFPFTNVHFTMQSGCDSEKMAKD